MPAILAGTGGPRKMWGSSDADGHRTWYGIWRVKVSIIDGAIEGPASAIQCPGLPIPGVLWIVQNEVDVYAWARSNRIVSPVSEVKEGWPCEYYDVQCEFSTKPPGLGGPGGGYSPDRAGRGQPEGTSPRKENPLLEKDKLSGGFVRYTEEATLDRFGLPLFTTSFEMIRGPQVEFDSNRPQVRIEQNVLDLQLPMLAQMADTVNDRPMWGFPKRCIKLGVPSWSMNYHGNGLRYYTRSLEFDINTRTKLDGTVVSGFDRDIYDVGTKALTGHWDKTEGIYKLDLISKIPEVWPNPGNPAHYSGYMDVKGNATTCLFDNTGSGLPLVEKMAGMISDVDAKTVNDTLRVMSQDHELVDGDIIVIRNLIGSDAKNVNDMQQIVQVINVSEFYLPMTAGLQLDQIFAPIPFLEQHLKFPAARWFKLTSKTNVLHFEKYEESNFLLLGLRIDGL